VAGEIPTAALMARQQRLKGLIVGSRRHQQDMVRAIDTIGMRPVIDRSFPLKSIADAFRVQTGGGHFGKIVLEV
jgi:NADPH:quinone reductase-like Zn-dependent oxidoreductase